MIKASGIRKYTQENIETISIIYTMLKKDGLTIQGAKKKLNTKDISESENLLILKKLNKIKDELKEIKKNL
jgi:DNA-binding transcriptional MerR regulator